MGDVMGFQSGSAVGAPVRGQREKERGVETVMLPAPSWQGCCWLVTPSTQPPLSSGSKLLSSNIQVWASPPPPYTHGPQSPLLPHKWCSH